MNAAILLIPLLLIRYGIPAFIHKDSLVKLAHYPAVSDTYKYWMYLYQVATIFLLIFPFFFTIQTSSRFIIPAMIGYGVGILLTLWSTLDFIKPTPEGLHKNGIYQYSRNPMYVGYFFYFLGIAGLSTSLLLFVALLLFQISCHFLILAEEKWCSEMFGASYQAYRKKVRRYL